MPLPTCPLSFAELAAAAPLLTHLPSPAPNVELPNCTFYKASTCCTADDALRISHSEPEIRLTGTTRGCRDVLHLMACSVCSPDQEHIFPEELISGFTVPVLRVCESFCDQLHRQCGSAAGKSGERVDVEFENGNDFCRAVGLRVASSGDESMCFSSARHRRRAPTFAAVALSVALSILGRCMWLSES